MMDLLERVSDDILHGWFVDLFVRVSNKTAIHMYERMGYSVYRRISAYYEGKDGTSDEDAFDMRKPMSRDEERRSVRPNGRDITIGREVLHMKSKHA